MKVSAMKDAPLRRSASIEHTVSQYEGNIQLLKPLTGNTVILQSFDNYGPTGHLLGQMKGNNIVLSDKSVVRVQSNGDLIFENSSKTRSQVHALVHGPNPLK